MKQSTSFFANPEIHQLKKIEEIRALSYEDRIKRLFVLIDISIKIKNSNKKK